MDNDWETWLVVLGLFAIGFLTGFSFGMQPKDDGRKLWVEYKGKAWDLVERK